MMTDQQKIIIDEELKKIGARLDNYDEFIEYCKNRGMFGDDVPFYNRVVFTRLNVKKLYKEFLSPIKQASKLLGLTYKELGEIIGYSESALTAAVVKDKISTPMIKAIELLLENHKLKDEVKKQNILFKTTIKEFLNS